MAGAVVTGTAEEQVTSHRRAQANALVGKFFMYGRALDEDSSIVAEYDRIQPARWGKRPLPTETF
jgi:hypothetical protein